MQTQMHEKLYICPGESHPISRSVHLSRLAAFYPVCRDCPYRGETGHLPKQTIERLQKTERRVERDSLFTSEGVRGVYLNELTRANAGAMAAALADLLWEESPLIGRTDDTSHSGRRKNPAIVVAHDERPSSPDIVTGVATALRQMGCQVIDVSLTTQPCFRFAVNHMEAAAGIFVTGAGCDPSWTGLDIVRRNAFPLSTGSGLERLEHRLQQPVNRPTRHAGGHRTFQAFVPYEAGLWKHFHALRPLKLAYACSTRLVRHTLERLFEKLPCQLVRTDVPVRTRDFDDPDDRDIDRLRNTVVGEEADLGVLIDDDGMRCAFLDERGTLIPPHFITRLIAELMLREHPQAKVIVEQSALEVLEPSISTAQGICIDGGQTRAEIAQAMHDHQAILAGGHSGRYWFHETFPTCDAILTIAKVLESLSRSDASFSDVARETRSRGRHREPVAESLE